jgi:hypothetical protein
MEHHGTTPRGAIHPDDLRSIVDEPGPFLSVYLTTEPAVENATQHSQHRWRVLRSQLQSDGVPEVVLAHVDPLVGSAHLHGACLAVVATAVGALLVEHGDEAPSEDSAWWEPLPHLVPVLGWRQAEPPYVVVLTDRTGADLFAITRGAPAVLAEAGGNLGPITKVAPGGWAQARYQRRAEQTWEQNAGDVAREVEVLVASTGARVVLVAGDVRAVQLLRDSLPVELAARLQHITGGRAEDAAGEETAREAARLVADEVARDTAALLHKVREELGQHDRAVSGAPSTIEALRRAQVDVLLVPAQVDRETRGWFGPDTAYIATSFDELRSMGVDHPVDAPLVDVLVRAALGTGAGLRVVPRHALPEDGIGALLRWAG